ncbi:2-oxoglutarate-dependent dioxygenase DAO-like isoform X1 [Juglans regia]|uniref:2-oxoglutarate-dependent dioxygenase DAO n=1 Tax=Juglans regia TaxID=51240 RepID=A0A6P9E0U6_JUGRE|nr:2-oxoglutarate-dependent dioxygenase DAO-like isoform X1 [Juglans regia]
MVKTKQAAIKPTLQINAIEYSLSLCIRGCLFEEGKRTSERAANMSTEGDNSNHVVPIIDMQEFDQDVEHYRKLREAAEEWGCFRVVNHNIPVGLMTQMKKVVSELFELPTETKRHNIDLITGSGYLAPNVANPNYESLGLHDLGSPQNLGGFFSQLDASPHQREILETYAQAIHELALDLGKNLAKSMGLVTDLFKEWPCQLRMNKYHFTPETVGSSGVLVHSDCGFLTIVQDDEKVGGLEAMDNLGAFVPIRPWPGTFLVNLGDVAKLWSNGRFLNVKHRVECKESSIRFSIASSILGPNEGVMEAPPELVDTEHPRLYAPITYEDYRKLRHTTKLATGEALELLRIHS